MAADANPFHNPDLGYDVNGDDVVAPSDALMIINELNRAGSRPLLGSLLASSSGGASGEGDATPSSSYLDVTNDGWLAPADALWVINRLNAEAETSPSQTVTFSMALQTLTGAAITNNTVNVGDKFQLVVSVIDSRPAGTPSSGPSGVFTAYLDVDYGTGTGAATPILRDTQWVRIQNPNSESGSFTLRLTFQGQSVDVPYDPDARPTNAQIRVALESLSNIDPGEVEVTAPLPPNASDDGYVLKFSGRYANTNLAPITAAFVNLPGGSAMATTVTEVANAQTGNATDFKSSVTFQDKFLNGTSAENGDTVVTNPNPPPATNGGTSPTVLSEIGAFYDAFAPQGKVAKRVFIMQFTATTAGSVIFDGNPADVLPAHAVSLFNDASATVNPDTIDYGLATLTVVSSVSAANDSAAVDEDTTAGVSIPVLANDTLNQGGTKAIADFTQPATGGTVTLNNKGTTSTADDELKFVPASNFFGSTSFTYRFTDGNSHFATATVSVTVNPVNDAPVNTVPATQTINEDATLTFSTANSNAITTNDVDSGTSDIRVTLTSSNGILNVASLTGLTSNSGNGTGTVQLTGGLTTIQAALASGITYTPPANFNGNATVVISTSDLGATGANNLPVLTDIDTVTVTVRSVNDAPVNTVPGAQSVIEGTPLVMSTANGNAISTSDVDAGTSNVVVTLSIAPTNSGVLNVGTGTGVTISGNGTTSLSLTGTIANINTRLASGLTFTPRTDGANPLNNFTGSVTLTVSTNDQGATGGTTVTPLTDVDTVKIDVVPAVRPFAVGDSGTTDEDSASGVTIDVTTNDVPNSGATIILKSFTQPATGGAVTQVGNALKFVPSADFNGATSFTYVINDSAATGADSTATVAVTVREANDAPIPVADTKSTNEDTVLTFPSSDLSSNDAKGPANESSQTLTVSLPSGSTSKGGTVTITGGNITYTPPANYNNSIGGPDTFTYTVTDNGTTAGAADPKSATGTVTINITAVNDAPVPVNDNKTAVEDTPLTFPSSDLTANDGKGGGSDEATQILTVTAVSATSQRGGTVSLASGNVTYTPAANFNGQDTFTYTVSDGQGQNSTATCTVTVAVSEVNDAPTAGNDTGTAVKNQGTTYSASVLLANDSPGPANESGQTLTITSVGNAVNGTVQLVGGNPVFTPNANFEGTGSFQYTVTDNGTTNGAADPKTATATVNLNVVNYIPSNVSGYVYVDLDNDGVKDGNEPALAGIDVTLSGTDFQGTTISNRTAITDRSGYYEFTNLSPGNYLVTQSQAANMVDGRETASGPVTVNANDQFRFNQSLQDNINAATHTYANNNFAERSVSSAFLPMYYLLASSADDPATTSINEAQDRLMFSFNDSGTNLDWYVFGAGWDNLTLNSITMAGDLRSATVRVTDAQSRVWQTTVTIDSARLRFRQDSTGRVMGSIEGGYADQTGWTQVAANGGGGEGEGEAYDQDAVTAEQYARAADAAFAELA